MTIIEQFQRQMRADVLALIEREDKNGLFNAVTRQETMSREEHEDLINIVSGETILQMSDYWEATDGTYWTENILDFFTDVWPLEKFSDDTNFGWAKKVKIARNKRLADGNPFTYDPLMTRPKGFRIKSKDEIARGRGHVVARYSSVPPPKVLGWTKEVLDRMDGLAIGTEMITDTVNKPDAPAFWESECDSWVFTQGSISAYLDVNGDVTDVKTGA